MNRSTPAFLLLAAVAAAGCSPGTSDSDGVPSIAMSLVGTTWQIEDIDRSGIVDRSMVTLQFPEEGRVAGSTGCNRYFGSVAIENGRLSFSQMGSTRRACVPALMEQEQRFLQAMQRVSSYWIDEGLLFLSDENGEERLRGVGIDADPTEQGGSASEPQDRAPATEARFDCASAGSVTIRFLGPETIELAHAGMANVLQLERSASGARYAGDGLLFWNKGEEAMFELDGETYPCRRSRE